MARNYPELCVPAVHQQFFLQSIIRWQFAGSLAAELYPPPRARAAGSRQAQQVRSPCPPALAPPSAAQLSAAAAAAVAAAGGAPVEPFHQCGTALEVDMMVGGRGEVLG